MKYAELAYNLSKELNSDNDIISTLLLKGSIFGNMLKPNAVLDVINEAEAFDIAQPSPLNETSFTIPSSINK